MMCILPICFTPRAVNELLESIGAPLEIVDGFVSSIAVTIPWAALVTDHCTLVISGLQITCRPKYRTSEFTRNNSVSERLGTDTSFVTQFLFSPLVFVVGNTTIENIYNGFRVLFSLSSAMMN